MPCVARFKNFSVRVTEQGGELLSIDIVPPEPVDTGLSPLAREAGRQMQDYMAGKLTHFNLPLRADGTEFQRAVWHAMAAVPYGETRSYAQLARAAGRPRASRAVGSACGRNPLPIVVPCHRIVTSDGQLGGYSGGVNIKAELLELERSR